MTTTACTVPARNGNRYGLTDRCQNAATGLNSKGQLACCSHGGPAKTPAAKLAQAKVRRTVAAVQAQLSEASEARKSGSAFLVRLALRRARVAAQKSRAAIQQLAAVAQVAE
jgi:hypothetical protein